MNPRFETTMRLAFRAAVIKAIDSGTLRGPKLALAENISKSYDRGVGAPRPRRDR